MTYMQWRQAIHRSVVGGGPVPEELIAVSL
jgi:hypothetical protein